MTAKPVRVLIVTDAAAIDGGISQVAVQSARGLAAAGHEVHYFAALGSEDGPLRSQLGDRLVLLHQHDIKDNPSRWRAATQGIANFSAARQFDALIGKIGRANLVVHVHGWAKALSPYLLGHIARRGLPLVTTVHDYFLACPNGGFYDFQRDEICERKPLSVACLACNCDSRRYADKVWRATRTGLQKHAMQIPARLRHFIVISPLSRRVMAPHLPPGAQLHDVANPIFVERRARTEAERNRPFLFVGRFSREKGVLQLAAAAGRTGAPVVFVGDGHLRPEMQRLAPRAEFMGWLPPEKVSDWMRRARAVVFPSTWYETLGLVPLEAAACGVPCLISDCTAATDFLRHDREAWHFPHADVPGLEAALASMADDSRVARLSQAAYDWYWSNPWTLERHVGALGEVYQRVLADAPRHES